MTNPHKQHKYSYGSGLGRYLICEVKNRDDPEQSGRCQVRIIGYQDDVANIPDEQLFWARPMAPITHAMDGGITNGGAITGLREGSFVYAFFATDQDLVMMGTMNKSGEEDKDGKMQQDGRKSDTPLAARDDRAKGKDVAFDGNDYRDKSITQYARVEAKNPNGRTVSKDADDDPNKSWSLGFFKYDDIA